MFQSHGYVLIASVFTGRGKNKVGLNVTNGELIIILFNKYFTGYVDLLDTAAAHSILCLLSVAHHLSI